MCGIAGFVDPSGRAPDPAALLAMLSKCMVARGPDGHGSWWDADGRAGLAHRRLSIIDLSTAGRQPMHSRDGRFTITFNGEVFNFKEIRRELEAAGVRFSSETDSEVVLEACAHWGVEPAIKRFVGMFALGLWDSRERRMWLVRDRLGVKPLAYQWVGGGRAWLAFASEVGPLRQLNQGSWNVDPHAVRSMLNGMCVPAPASIWEGVRKLPPGHMARFDAATGELHVQEWWSLDQAAAQGTVHQFQGSDEDAVSELDARIQEYVRVRLVADVPVGAFLSGGIDSSAVAAAMRRATTAAVRTYSIGFAGVKHEADDAAAIAKHLGTEHVSFIVDGSEALQTAQMLPHMFDEPFGDSSQVPTAIVSRLARQEVTVALTGDGGDEAFGGYYRHFMAHRLARRAAMFPQPLRNLAAASLRAASPDTWERIGSAINPLLPARYRQHRFGSRIHKLGALMRSEGAADLYEALVASDASALCGPNAQVAPAPRRSPSAALADPSLQFMLSDQLAYLPDDVLTKVDRCSMSASLEARTPLLDHRLVEFAWTLPARMKIRDGVGKWILRQVLRRHVPAHLWERPKSGFGAPVQEWMRKDLRKWAEDLLLNSEAARAGWLDQPALTREWTRFQGRELIDFNALWSAAMLEGWYRRWICGGA